MMRIFLPMLIAAALAHAGPGIAQQTEAPEQNDEIVVSALPADALRRFVEALTHVERGKQVARWNGHVCAQVMGFERPGGEFVHARITAAARSAGILVAPKGRCAPNIVVVATADADGFTAALARKHPKLFGYFRDPVVPRKRIAELLRPRPVRWIAASRTGSRDGRAIYGTNMLYSASRIALPSRRNAALSVLIVDTGKLDQISWGQLADYLSLVALTSPRMDQAYDEGTILSIFARRDAGARGPRALTSRDKALLQALYGTDATLDADAQRTEIVTGMKSEKTAE